MSSAIFKNGTIYFHKFSTQFIFIVSGNWKRRVNLIYCVLHTFGWFLHSFDLGITQRCCMIFVNKSWKQHPTKGCCMLFGTNLGTITLQNSRCIPIYLHLANHSRMSSKKCWALLEKKGPTHKLYSPMDSYSWTCQGSLTSKNLHSSALCVHWVPSRELIKGDCWLGEMAKERVKELELLTHLDYCDVHKQESPFKRFIHYSLLFSTEDVSIKKKNPVLAISLVRSKRHKFYLLLWWLNNIFVLIRILDEANPIFFRIRF